MANDTRTLEEIRRDAERARAGLTETVGQLRATVSDTADDLRERYSPQAIRAEVSGYIKSRGEELMDAVNSSIRNNPVQAVAVGATLAYPLWKVIRAIPTPVLMVGAGIYFAGTRSGQQITQRASDAARDMSRDLERRAREFGADAADTAEAAREYASGMVQAAGEVAATRAAQFRQAAGTAAADLKQKGTELSRQVSHSGDDLSRRAAAAGEAFAAQADEAAAQGSGLAGAVSDAVRETAEQVRDRAAETAARLRDRLGHTADASLDAAARLRDRTMEVGEKTGRTVKQTITDHPLLVAGVGLLVGGLIASAFPRTRSQGTRIARDLGGRAQEAMARGVDKGRAAYAGAARAAEEEGLTKEQIAEDVRDLGQRMRKVADAAVSSFDAPPQNKH